MCRLNRWHSHDCERRFVGYATGWRNCSRDWRMHAERHRPRHQKRHCSISPTYGRTSSSAMRMPRSVSRTLRVLDSSAAFNVALSSSRQRHGKGIRSSSSRNGVNFLAGKNGFGQITVNTQAQELMHWQLLNRATQPRLIENPDDGSVERFPCTSIAIDGPCFHQRLCYIRPHFD